MLSMLWTNRCRNYDELRSCDLILNDCVTKPKDAAQQRDDSLNDHWTTTQLLPWVQCQVIRSTWSTGSAELMLFVTSHRWWMNVTFCRDPERKNLTATKESDEDIWPLVREQCDSKWRITKNETSYAILFWRQKRIFSMTRKGRRACVLRDAKTNTNAFTFAWPKTKTQPNFVVLKNSQQRKTLKNSDCWKTKTFCFFISLLSFIAEITTSEINWNVSDVFCLNT